MLTVKAAYPVLPAHTHLLICSQRKVSRYNTQSVLTLLCNWTMWVRFLCFSVILNSDVDSSTVSSLTVGPRVEEAMWRTIRWLDRCIEHHQKSGKDDVQNLFAIVQGGLEPDLRDKCLDEMVARKDRVAGYAIGGLSGGEAKGTHTTDCSEGALRIDTSFQTYSGGCECI